ncbi:MAG TPA: hypothetical protein VKS25_06035 [Solirubrobacteraceae bacterium]|nr:hypothetical protein [Solirubrobacteraceae bacterium]
MDVRRIMARSAPLKPEFGPTLPQLLAPRMHRLPLIVKRVAAVVVVILVVLIVVLALRLRDPTFSYPAPRPTGFSTTYSRSLKREPARPGVPLTLVQNSSVGLENFFQVKIIELPAYSGQISGLLPIIASNMITRMQAADPTFTPYSRGRTRINKIPGYTFTFQELRGGRRVWGRIVLITHDIDKDREGLLITMLADPTPLGPIATRPVTPDSVGTVGVLFEPYERLKFH